MSQIEEILGRNINSVKELKSAIKDLQDSLVGLDKESDEYKQTAQQLIAAQNELKNTTRAGVEANLAEKDSLIGLKNEYKELYNTYKQLTEEQRNSPMGKEMAASLETLSNKINETQKGIGDWHANIGRYAEGVTDAFNKMGMSLGGLQKPMDLATKGTKTFGTALKGLAANPIVLVITALVAILVKAADSIKKNEELTNRLKEAMAVFKPVLDAISNVFDFLAGLLVKTAEGLAKVAEKILSIIPGMKQAIQSHKDLAKATNDLTKAQRENSVVASQKNAEIERLREEASATDDVIEKKKLLEEAKALQAEVDQREIELAQEELRILQEYGEKTANSAEENEKLAAAQKKVNDAIAQGERNMRQYNKQLDAVTKGTNSATSSGKNYREEAKKLYEQTIENSKDELTKLTEKYEKEKKLLEKYHYDTKLLTKKYEEDVAKLRIETFRKGEALLSDEYSRAGKSLQEEMADTNNPLKALETQLTTYEEAVPKVYKRLRESLTQSLNGQIKPIFDTILFYEREGDLKNITNFQNVLNLLEGQLANFPKDAENTKKMIQAIKDLGEEGWISLTEDVQNAAVQLNNTFGITFNTLGELVHEMETNLPDKIKEIYGQLAQVRVDETMKKANEGFLNLEVQKIVEDLGKNLDSNFWQSIMDEIKGVYAGVFQGARDEYSILVAENTYDALQKEKEALAEEVVNFKGTQDQKIALLQRYYEVVQEIRDKELELTQLQQERTAQMVESMIDLTDKLSSSMNTYRSTMESVIDSEVKQGKISEKEAERKKRNLLKLEAAETAFSIATITADAAAGIFSVWKGYASERGTINPQTAAAAGPGAAVALTALNMKSLITAIAQTASLATTAAAQIAAARGKYVSDSNNFHAEAGGGTSVASVPNLIDSQPYTFTQTVQNVDTEDELNKRPIIVRVEDIIDGVEGHNARVSEASF